MGASATWSGPLLGLLADREKYPEFPPEFAVHCGWLVLGLCLLVAALAWVRIESVRRFLFALDDPRVFAVLRIGFAIMTIVCFLNLQPYWRFLWSDEGIFDLEHAQEKLGRQALRGWDPEEGFYDYWAVLNFLWNKPSLFYIWGSPDFVVGYMLVFFGVLVLYGAGVGSRTTGIVAWLLMSGVYNRNALYLEGTDTVYRCFWLILLFAKTGHAWSFDNWWRCRRLRKQGRLEQPDAPPDADDDPGAGVREPIYRRVPAWPRYLFMLQLAALYCSTGSVKTGSIWAAGDALYYALNMDHFYRFEWVTQQVSAVFGTNLFRVNTWVTHWWERLFPLMLVGVALQFTLRHRHEPWYRAQDTVWRRWGGRALLVAIWALAWRINYLVLPFCLQMVDDAPQDPAPAILKIHIAWGVVIPAVVVAWYALGRWPIVLWRGGRALPGITRRVPWLRMPELRLEQETLRALLLGRRVWLTLGFCFHGFLILFMNIGMFPFIMLMTYAAFVTGEEHARIYRRVLEVARRIKGVRRLVPRGYAQWFGPSRVNPVQDDPFDALGALPLLLAGVVVWLFGQLVPSLGFDPRLMLDRTPPMLVLAVLWLAGGAALELGGRRGRLFGLPTSAVAALYCGHQAGAWLGSALGLAAGAALAVALALRIRRIPIPAPLHAVRGRKIPDLVVLALGLLGAGLLFVHALARTSDVGLGARVWAKVDKPEWVDDTGTLTHEWMVLVAVVALAFRLLPPRAADIRAAREPGPSSGSPAAPLAYGAFGRALALLAVMYHSLAVGLSLLPSYPILNKWRSPAASIFGGWLRGTATNQSWQMFAPNPPRSNTFLETVVVEADGDRWDLRNNAFHYRPNPWIWNDRMRKMHRRMAGKGKHYLKDWATWQCREWELATGEKPVEVEMSSIVTNIPSPEAVAEKGPYHPRKLKPRKRQLQTQTCKGAGELPLQTKERHGLPITDEDRAKAEIVAERRARKFASRKSSWDGRRDFGNWAKAEEDERARREQAEERKRKRDLATAGLTPVTRPAPAEPDEDPQEQDIDDEGALPNE